MKSNMKHQHHSHSRPHTNSEERIESCCSTTTSHTEGPHVHSEEHRASQEHACCSSKRGAADSSVSKDPGIDRHGSIDPVCGMQVGTDSPHSITHEGQRYVFCSAGCRVKFAANPAKYVTASHDHHHDHGAVATRKPDTDVPSGTIYTCPMHPQVRQLGPGSCPICGMALEPEMPAEQEDDREIRKVRTKFWIALAFTLPI
ncbi:MAG TPA: YHS domain-containing protein, partial [Pyrinomonadaceae bacterium]